MSLKDRMYNFNKRWNIVSTDSYEEAFGKFKTRILNIFKDIDRHVTKESITEFCQFYGIKEVWHSQSYGDHFWSTNIIDRLKQEEDEKEFYRLIELIFSLDIRRTTGYGGAGETYGKNTLFKSTVEAVELSEVNVSITAVDGEVILYPKGEGLLDKELVDFPLLFLDQKSAEHFIQALQLYQSKKYIKSAESIRRSLEEFLRIKLNNSKGLDANISELQKQLKSKKGDPQIRNVISSVFNCLDLYFNENSKHNDGDIDDSENEFLIYQVGLLMRYVAANI